MYRYPRYLADLEAPLRSYVRDWVAAHPKPTAVDFARAGLVAPSWPKPWGLAASSAGQLVIRDELARAGLRAPYYTAELGWVGRSILIAGTAEQQERYLWPMLERTERWCRLHSEPDAGSDLTMVSTRADRTESGYRISGQKTWIAQAEGADFGALLARTSGTRGEPSGLTYLVVPMTSDRVTVIPIKDITGGKIICDVYLDDLEIPAENLLGAEGDGLRLRRPDHPAAPTFTQEIGYGPNISDVFGLPETAAADAVLDRLLDLYLASQAIDGLTVLDVEEELAGLPDSAQRPDIRRYLVAEFIRGAYVTIHDCRAAALSLGEDAAVAYLDALGLTDTINGAALAAVAAGGSDIHLEAVTARLYDSSSPVRHAWSGET